MNIDFIDDLIKDPSLAKYCGTLKDKLLFITAINSKDSEEIIKSIKAIENQDLLKDIVMLQGVIDIEIIREGIKKLIDRDFLKDLCEKYRSDTRGISFDCFYRLKELPNSVHFILED